MRIIKAMEEKYLLLSLELVQTVFTEHENEAEGKLVRALVEEIRASRFYRPQLEFVTVDEADEVIGYCMFSAFHLQGKYEDRLLILTPVAVKTALQRQHISRDMIEHGFRAAAALGYTAAIVEGNPRNYNARGFETSARYGITAHESVHLPAPECLMAKALVPGGLEGVSGQVCYSDDKSLT